MQRSLLRRAFPVFILTATGITTRLPADVLYSNLQGNYLSQQTASYTYAKPNTDYGATGFGTYYNTGYDEVTLSSISFYGGTGELYNASNGSWGDGLYIYFYDAAGNFSQKTITEEANGPGQNRGQGIGLHTFGGFSIQIAGAGYVMFTPFLAQGTDLGVFPPQTSPLAPGPATFTAFYGAAPTVGQTDPTVSEFEDTNRNLSTTSLVSVPAYMQLELDGTGSGASYYPTATPIWNFNGSGGTWDNSSNWTLGLPNAAGATANFTGAISANTTVTLVAGETVGILNFDNPNSYTLAGSGSLTLSNSSGGAAINSWAGSQIITTPVTYTAGVTVTTFADPSPSSPSLILPLNVTATGVLTKLGPGTLAFAASTSGITTLNLPSINISAGTVALQSNSVHTNRTLLTTASLSIGIGKLDLGNNDLDDSGDTLTSINAFVASGYANGSWKGTGIDSSAAASNSTHLTALGVIQNNQGGSPLFTAANPFDGTTPGASDILVKYTYYGDTNLDGKVDGADYSRIDNAYLNNRNSANPQLTGWFNGDFNYDGVVDGSDYTLIDNAFNMQGAALTAEIASSTALIAGAGGTSAVPEPASVGMLVLAAAGLLGRRRHM